MQVVFQRIGFGKKNSHPFLLILYISTYRSPFDREPDRVTTFDLYDM